MVVNARQLIDIITTSFEVQSLNDSVLIPLIIGNYGIGKTSIIKVACKLLQLEPVFVVLTGFDPSLWQIPIKSSSSSSSSDKEVYSLSSFKFLGDPKKALVLDEIHLADRFELNPLISILVGRKIADISVRCKIICLANNDLILKNPSFSSRLIPFYLQIPSSREVVEYIISQHSQIISTTSKFTQTIISSIFEYIKLFGVHDDNDIPTWTPRTVESLVLYLCQYSRQYNPSGLDAVTISLLNAHLRHRYNEFMALLDEIDFPDPHSSDKNEVVEFLKKPVSSAHFAFTRLYTIHIVNCEEPHPLDPTQFVLLLPSSLIDTFITTLQSIRNPRVSKIIALLSSNPQTSKLISSYTTMSIK